MADVVDAAAPAVTGDEAPRADRPAASKKWWATADARGIAVLVAVPLAFFVVPALFGHPAISGDNAIQNFPLRVLTGRLLRQGHLPLWNVYVWSGSPLLGGLNAGSAYPLTALFAAVPAVAAWVANMVAVYWAAGLGVYVLLRQFSVRPLAAVLAGLTYSLTGAMAGQMVHLGVIQGMGWAPWLALAIVRLSWAALSTGPVGGPARSKGPWPWVVLGAGVIGLVVLTGEPRAMAEAEVVGLALVAWLALRPYPGGMAVGRRASFVGYAALAAVWGGALGAIQAIPGWSFINASQRASESYWYFGSGSLHPSWTALLLVPDLFGGDGLFHQPAYFNSYNLAEVTGYVGLVPLVAAVALLTRSFGRQRDPRSADWGLWLGLLGLGLLLSWGSYTPLGHVFVHLPLFGKTRLQSRNLEIVDLALAVLLGFWADRALGPDPAGAGLTGRRRFVAVVPAVAAALLLLSAIAIPGPLEQAFGATSSGGVTARSLTPWFLAGLVVAVGVVALVLCWTRIDPGRRRLFLTVVVVADIGLFVLAVSTGLSNGHQNVEPSSATAEAVFGTTGRFAIYDTSGPTDTLDTVGQPDLNVFTGLPSVQGYGSIVSGAYGTATGTHTLDTLTTCALARGTFAPLRLSAMLTHSWFLADQISPGATPAPLPTCPGAPVPGAGGRRTLFLGQVADVASVDLDATSAMPKDAPPLRLGVLRPGGTTAWPTVGVRRVAGGWTVRFGHPQQVVGLVVSGPARWVSVTSEAVTTTGERFAFNGALQDAVATPAWRYGGMWRQFTRFSASTVRPPYWIAGSGDGTVRGVSATQDGRAVADVTARRPVTVVRSEAYLEGWTVDAVPRAGGAARTLPVVPDGLVQAVRVPAGEWTLTYHYRPKGLDAGIALTLAGALAMVATGAYAVVRRRRRAVR